jgi:hypothetical protein
MKFDEATHVAKLNAKVLQDLDNGKLKDWESQLIKLFNLTPC